MRKILLTTILTLGLASSAALANEGGHKLLDAQGSYNGIFGRFDRAQVQRGFQIYKEVCSSCHSMKELHYRNLGEKGGPYYDPKFPNANDNPVVKAIAKGYKVKDVDATVSYTHLDVYKRQGSALAMVRNMILRDVSVRVLHRKTLKSHLLSICQTPK